MAKILNIVDLVGKDPSKADWFKDIQKKLDELHQFRTYSYHHIMVVGNTDAAVEYATNTSNVETLLHPSYENKYQPITTPSGPNNGQYIILINGMTDAEFSIQSLEVETIIDPSAMSSNPHGSWCEGTMEIVEPKGVRFMNLMKNACDDLRCDPSSLVFALKTLFVGYTDGEDGEPRIQRIIETAPFQFLIMDLTGEFNAYGSTYQIQFTGNVNGTSRMPMYSKVQMSNVVGGTVEEAIASLEKNLNQAARKSYETVIKQIDERNKADKQPGANYSPKGRPVEYVIQVADAYKTLPLDNVHKRNVGASNQAQMGTPQGIDIETAITDIMLGSTKLLDMQKEGTDEGYNSIFKIESAITSTIDKIVVQYAVKKCKVPLNVKDNTNNQGKSIAADISDRIVLEFEYMFTGKNIEVLEYDMKMTMGLAFFQSFGSSNNLPGAFKSASGNVTTLGSGAGTFINDRGVVIRDMTGIPISSTIHDPAARNKVEPAKTEEFRVFMARQAAYESVNSKIRIAGIPWLLEAFNQSNEDALDPNKDSIKQKVPLIKVKVRMPNADDVFIDDGGDYANDFWYDGCFQILSCKNVFRDGRFEQELDMIALLSDVLVESTPAGSAPTKEVGGTPLPSSQANPTPTIKTAPQKTDKSKNPEVPATAEQKKKMGEKPTPLTPDEILNCQSIRKQPITMESARRTFLSKTVTLEALIRRPVNIPHLTDRILNNLCAVAKKIEELQELLGHRITITSGFRCASYNGSTPGSSKTSDHMQAVAIDFVCPAYGNVNKIFETLKTSKLDIRQVIKERKRSSGSEWIHISFNVDPTLPPTRGPKFHTLVV